jgi:predicted transcriptional regulator
MTPNLLSRRDDAGTSRDAAHAAVERGMVERHQRAIAVALLHGPASKCDIARRSGLTEQQVARRLAEMRRRGTVERTGRYGRSDSGHREAEYQLIGIVTHLTPQEFHRATR